MIFPGKIEETMNEWPTYWTGSPSKPRREFREILANLKLIWELANTEPMTEIQQELHFKALWILGYELSRDRIMSPNMSVVPIKLRIRLILEDGGPLLFGYYSSDDEDRFEKCCVTFERVLRRNGLWEDYSQGMTAN